MSRRVFDVLYTTSEAGKSGALPVFSMGKIAGWAAKLPLACAERASCGVCHAHIRQVRNLPFDKIFNPCQRDRQDTPFDQGGIAQ